MHSIISNAKPFLKWAGGKSQLLTNIEATLPRELARIGELTYVEPFVGGGAVLFWFLKRYRNVQKAVICDVNERLINAYRTVQRQPHALINTLMDFQRRYDNLLTEDDRREFFLEQRERFNSFTTDALQTTALLIFLNKTCFNGLYRVNRKGEFNVPFGKYFQPKICFPEVILADSALLQKVTILDGDYTQTLTEANRNSFFYLDPPYKPLSATANFTAYSAGNFTDDDQRNLADFCRTLDLLGSHWLLSNADLTNTDITATFFDDLYGSYNIQKVHAKRSINSDASRRGAIYELLIANYNYAHQLAAFA
jgi:DNA adenine methylase